MLALGHEGGICPTVCNMRDDDHDSDHNDDNVFGRLSSVLETLTAIDVTGFHELNILFCHCEGAPSLHIQLLRARLFPATVARPKTVFSFAVLDLFHTITLQGKTSAFDYYVALQRVTNGAAVPSMVSC